jgi:hypothetical protein
LNSDCKIQESKMSLLNRIKKVEATMLQPALGAVLLREPAEDAGTEAREAFEAAIAEAIEAGHQVVVRTACYEPNRRMAGVIYESDGFVALLALAAHTPATDGRSKDMLCQALAEARGSALPVVREVSHDSV